MNYSMIRKILGKLLIVLAILMLLPLIVAIIYREPFLNILSFLIPIASCALLGFLMNLRKAKKTNILARDGFVIVSLSWLIMSLFGSIPFIVSKQIPNFFDAFFEITSGFTTTGASILIRVEDLSKSMMFWRSFSHWIGGMGVLVFILAIIPESKQGSSMHILRAESPGPQVGKLVSKMQASSRILYLIYIALTAAEILFLYLGPDEKMSLFNSVIYAMGTAGTGGFSVDSSGLALYSHYSQYVISTFMVIFGINFTLFYFILLGNIKDVFKNEELRWYLGIVIVSVAIICYSIYPLYHNFEESFRLSFFQVASIVSTTGFSTIDYNVWGSLPKGVLVVLMFFGACAGSTAGGIKVSRLILLFKASFRRIGNMINPRKVDTVKVNGKRVEEGIVESAESFFIVYFFILALCALIISIDGFDPLTNITASLSCISNVGPGLNVVGPAGNFSGFSSFSKLILSIEMLAGRLELFPILVLFSPKTWIRKIK